MGGEGNQAELGAHEHQAERTHVAGTFATEVVVAAPPPVPVDVAAGSAVVAAVFALRPLLRQSGWLWERLQVPVVATQPGLVLGVLAGPPAYSFSVALQLHQQ